MTPHLHSNQTEIDKLIWSKTLHHKHFSFLIHYASNVNEFPFHWLELSGNSSNLHLERLIKSTRAMMLPTEHNKRGAATNRKAKCYQYHGRDADYITGNLGDEVEIITATRSLIFTTLLEGFLLVQWICVRTVRQTPRDPRESRRRGRRRRLSPVIARFLLYFIR